jgi:hypothetical protein
VASAYVRDTGSSAPAPGVDANIVHFYRHSSRLLGDRPFRDSAGTAPTSDYARLTMIMGHSRKTPDLS